MTAAVQTEAGKAALALKAGFFYAGIPFLICVYLALNNWVLLESLGFPSTLGFYLAHAAVPWTITVGVTATLHRLLARWHPGLLTLTLLGSLVACIPAVPYTAWLMSVWPGDAVSAGFEAHAVLVWDWRDILGYAIRATVIWVGLNFLFDRYLGLPRYRYVFRPELRPVAAAERSERGPGGAVAQSPAFMQRLKKPVAVDELLALRAEQHYLRVITRSGRELILYRFSDALRELPAELGIQVHRSWWVCRAAIASIECRERKMTLVLGNGEQVPVSAPYQALVRTLAATAGGAC